MVRHLHHPLAKVRPPVPRPDPLQTERNSALRLKVIATIITSITDRRLRPLRAAWKACYKTSAATFKLTERPVS